MAGNIDREAFVAMLAERYPAIAADIDDCIRGLLHMEMGQLAIAVQAAITDEDIAAVREHFRFIDEVYRRGTPEVKNAVHVSYLERLGFDGKARQADQGQRDALASPTSGASWLGSVQRCTILAEGPRLARHCTGPGWRV